MKSYVDEDYDDRGNMVGERYYVHDCPFCGSKKTDLYEVQVKCQRCDAQGPCVGEQEWWLAITLWNDLPRKQGDELKELRRHWASLQRRIRQAEERLGAARAKAERDLPEARRLRAEARQTRADRKWAAEREAWLHSPIEGSRE